MKWDQLLHLCGAEGREHDYGALPMVLCQFHISGGTFLSISCDQLTFVIQQLARILLSTGNLWKLKQGDFHLLLGQQTTLHQACETLL